MEEWESTIVKILRSSEILKVALEAIVVQEDGHSEALLEPSPTASFTDQRGKSSTPGARRILAVVSYPLGKDAVEEGSLFVLRPRSTPGSIDVQRIFPIAGNFTIQMSQSRRRTLDISSKNSLSQPRSELTMTIIPDDEEIEHMTLMTTDVDRLKLVIKECKRLKVISGGIQNSAKVQNYTWTAPYTTSRRSAALFSSTPEDLRLLHQPLHERLSLASAGLPGDDATDIALIREHWVSRRAREICKKAGKRTLWVRAGTFNVNGKSPSQDLSPWVRGASSASSPTLGDRLIPPLRPLTPLSINEAQSAPHSLGNSDTLKLEEALSFSLANRSGSDKTRRSDDGRDVDQDPDLLVLGLQEMDLSAEALLRYTGSTKEDAWTEAIFAGLGEKAELYEKLASKQLVGIFILLVVKKSQWSFFTNVKICAAGTGIMGVMGNKGATAIRVTYIPPSSADVQTPCPIILTFVNAHLAAFDEMLDKRNADFHDLSQRLGFDTSILLDVPSADASAAPGMGIYASDVLFWMGGQTVIVVQGPIRAKRVRPDLNYRIDLADSDIRTILADSVMDKKLVSLLQYDQLRRTADDKKAFEYFSEAEIKFPPSYRFGTSTATDSLGYDRKRKPAWTDRILHIASPTVAVELLSYSSHPQITMSDHRPVSAEFLLKLDVMERGSYESSVQGLYHRVAGMEDSEEAPKLVLDTTSIDLGHISYQRKVSKQLQIQNAGRVPCTFRFVPQDFDSVVYPDWLQISTLTGLLLPGENLTIHLTANIDNASASRLNLVSRHIDATLILHTSFGRDHFISLTAEYDYTCFGNDLSRLVRLPGAIRSLQSGADLLLEEQAVNAPREMMRLVNWLMAETQDSDQLMSFPASEELVTTIRECLDTGDNFPFPSAVTDPNLIPAFAETLIRLLNSLPEPVIPATIQTRCVQMTSREEAFELLSDLSGPAVNVWISVTAFLHYIIQRHVEIDKTRDKTAIAQRLAAIFAPALLRDDTTGQNAPLSLIGRRAFLLYFIA